MRRFGGGAGPEFSGAFPVPPPPQIWQLRHTFKTQVAHLISTLELRDFFGGSWLRHPYIIFTIEQSNIHKASMVILRHGTIELSSV